jgi:hypothetical protein
MEAMTRLCIVVAIVTAATAASADKADEAKTHFKNGTELYDENNFRGALVEFQRAYELQPSYKILFNIGQVEMELQDYAGALKAYTRYLREGGPDVPPARAAEVKAEIDRLKGRVGYVTIQTAAGAEVLIDNVPIGFAPLPEPATVNTGRHDVTVHIKGRDPVSRAVDVAGQQQLTVALENDLPPVHADPVIDKPGRTKPASKVPMIAAWSVAGAFAVTSGVFGFIARNDANKLAALRGQFPVTRAQLDDQGSKQKLHAALADGFGAAAAIGGGFALYVTLTRPHAEVDKGLSLHVSPTGMSVAGHF